MVKTRKSRILCVLLLIAMIATVIAPAGVFTASAEITTPVSDAANWDKVVDGWYTAKDGGFKFYVGTWSYYGSYGLTLVEDATTIPTSAATIAVYAADSEEVFENKTQADFESVLQETATVFEKRTVGNSEFTMYYCQTSVYENYVFQANGNKYFINFIHATGDRAEFTTFVEGVMDSIVIADDEPAFEGVKSVTHEVINDRVVFTIVTTAGDYNRVKVALADNAKGYIGYTSAYEVNADGDYVWTINAKIPAQSGNYVIDLRSSETGMYLQDYYEYDVEVEIVPVETIKDVSYEVVNGKVYFTVTTGAGAYNRVKLAYADDEKSYIAYARDYEVNADGDYVWSIKAAAPAETTDYVLDIRSSVTGKYMKAYYDCTVEVIPNIKKISGEQVDDKIVFTVTTVAGDFNRIKVAYADNAKGYIAYTNSYVVNADGDYEWTLTVDMPTETTTYAFDLRSAETNTYNRVFYYADVEVIAVPDAPTEDLWNTVVDGWYFYADGKVAMYVGDWIYYGSYGLTLVGANVVPIDAATIAIYTADSDEVFAAKTADDFASVLQEEVTSFEAVTVAGQYPGYIAKTASYFNLVFQANGYKYFINYINVADDAAGVDTPADFAIAVDSIVVY